MASYATPNNGFHALSFLKNLKFKKFTDEKTWEDAETHCQGEGGHLASVLDKDDQKEMTKAGGLFGWIGGTNLANEGLWQWADGSPWGTQYFQTDLKSSKKAQLLAWYRCYGVGIHLTAWQKDASPANLILIF